MKKLEFRGCVEEVKDRKAKGGFRIALDGEVSGFIPWVGVRVLLYVQTEEEAKEFPIGKTVAITVGEYVPEPPKCPHLKWHWGSAAVKECDACGEPVEWDPTLQRNVLVR